MVGWRLSGLRRVAHLIYENGEFLNARCGTFWWMSDGVSSSGIAEGTPKCKRCQSYEDKHRA